MSNQLRLDRLDLLDSIGSSVSTTKVLFLRIIQDAAINYLNGLVEKNGIGADEFFSAWKYFFEVTSESVCTSTNRKVKKVYIGKGKKIIEDYTLTDSELRDMCFDQHLKFSGLDDYVSLDNFRKMLREKRRKTLSENWEQVLAVINGAYKSEIDKVTSGKQIPLRIWNDSVLDTLVDPGNAYRLAELLYVPSKIKRIKKIKAKKVTASKFQEIAKALEAGIQESKEDWGPLSRARSINAEAVTNNSNNSLCGNTN